LKAKPPGQATFPPLTALLDHLVCQPLCQILLVLTFLRPLCNTVLEMSQVLEINYRSGTCAHHTGYTAVRHSDPAFAQSADLAATNEYLLGAKGKSLCQPRRRPSSHPSRVMCKCFCPICHPPTQADARQQVCKMCGASCQQLGMCQRHVCLKPALHSGLSFPSDTDKLVLNACNHGAGGGDLRQLPRQSETASSEPASKKCRAITEDTAVLFL
jgi:hypothetical protein